MTKKFSFKKTCISCGEKVDSVFEGRCSNCLQEEVPPIKEIKELNFKICNVTKKILYNNHYYEQEEIQTMLPTIMKKQVVINQPYVFKSLSIEDFEIEGQKISFDVIVECELED